MERADVPSVEGEVVFLTIWFKRLMGSPRLIVWLGLFVFLYALLARRMLQLWAIPAFFTQPGAVEGLVVLDSLEFDRIAKRKAAEIVSLGWLAWELKPEGQFPAGMASVFYALFGPAPTSMGEAGRDRCLQEFLDEKMLKSTESLYLNLVAQAYY